MSIPISPELLQSLASLSPTQLAWLSGYAWANSQQQNTVFPAALPVSGVAEPVAARKVLVLSASQTGNARRVAESLQLKLEAAGINAALIASGDYKIKQLSNEDILLLVTSTQGEGEPPEEALPLYKYLFGKKAPALNQLHFAVLGLGDSSYPQFCQCAKDFDNQLAHLGAQRLAERTDCDVDYQSSAAAWQDKIIALISELNNTNSASISNEVQQSVVAAQTAVFTKAAPFSATLSLRQRITTPEANKDVEHIEIDLTGSGIRYQPGDALGVFYQNAATLVEEILQHTQVDRDALVRLADGREISIGEALQNELDITQNTPALVQNYARQIQNAELDEIVADSTALKQFIATTPPVSVLAVYPHLIDAQALHDLFRPLTPRLYSIASSQDEVGEEVHLTVGVVRFIQRQRQYTGGASGFLGERLPEGEAVRVFIEENHRFRLPENGDAGENWLFFGNQKFTDDFLYQAEWLQYRKSGLLTRYDVAWSRQENEKVYVQHKLRERAQDIWEWLQRGAHIYVCGDAGKMARDVEQALLDIVTEQGKLSSEDADEYLSELRQQQRYQRDVY